MDFHLLTGSIENIRQKALAEKEGAGRSQMPSASALLSTQVQPDTSMIEKMANLLNIKLGGSSPIGQNSNDDDLSAILGSSKANQEDAFKTKKGPISSVSSPGMDVRSKYATKLRNKIDGGVAGLDLANFQKVENSKRGDAQSHMAARAMIASNVVPSESTSSTRWLATTGAGKLLSFASIRSMQIVLLPLPSTPSKPQTEDDVKKTSEEMESLTRQFPNVHFDMLVPDGRRRGEVGKDGANDDTAQDVLNRVLSELDVPPLQFVVVSDRDDYLRAARESGMFTCRVRPKNMRRGEVTASYNVEDVGLVEGIINEINGVSFNVALKG